MAKEKAKKPTQIVGTVQVPIKGKVYIVHISPLGPMAQLPDLESALESNREQLRYASEQIKKTVRTEVFDQPAPWLLNYESPTQLAIVAHLNINVLIPMINAKGGKAEYTKFETWNVVDHVERLHTMAQKNVLETFHREQRPFQMAFIAILLLLVFIVLMV